MPFQAGDRLGPYEILGFIGAGGMGEVYQSRDPRLNRTVALKILPAERVVNQERRSRFLQEAQLAAALDHPNIVTIFEIGSADGIDYIAMERVQGRTLEEMMAGKRLRLNEALLYGVQIADALAVAHAAGIVHRDLKPGNVMITGQRQVKILDFGLAKLMETSLSSGPDPTLTRAAVARTEEGTILGSIAYMSPEQAEGLKVDARSDIFSFGAILYEMLSGQRAFQAETRAGTLAAVINQEPKPLSAIAGPLPPGVERIVSRCLRKDLTRRAQHIADVKLALEELKEDTESGTLQIAPAASATPPRRWTLPAVAAIAVIGLAGAAAFYARSAPARPTAFEAVPLTTLPGAEVFPTFSPDGTQVAFHWNREGSQYPDIYLQLIGGGPPLRLTNDGGAHGLPAWSPDGKSIAMLTVHPDRNARGIAIIPSLGGPERHIPDTEWATGSRIAWSPDGNWLAASPVSNIANRDRGIVFIPLGGGEPIDLARLNPAFAGSRDPAFSPDGKRLAYVRTLGDFSSQIGVVDLTADKKPGTPRNVSQVREGANPIWTADGTEILFIDGNLTSDGGVSRVRADGNGTPQRIGGLGYATSLAISRDGRKLAFSRGGNDSDIWRIDLRGQDPPGQIASSTLFENGGAYSPDGKRIVFSSNRSGAREIWVADGNGENALQLTNFGGPVPGTARWSPDGTQIAFDARPQVNSDIFVISAGGGTPRRLTKDPGEDARPAWSPDGKFIYYSSDRGGGGRSEIWRMLADGTDPVQITRNGGRAALATPDGQWLYYNRGGGGLYKIRPDGSGDAEAIQEALPAALGFTVTRRGVWFVAGPVPGRTYWSVRVMEFAGGRTTEAAKLDFIPQVGLSLTPDDRYVLLSRPDTRGTDLLLVDKFQ